MKTIKKKLALIFITTLFILITGCLDEKILRDNIFDPGSTTFKYAIEDKGPAGGWIFYINPNYNGDHIISVDSNDADWALLHLFGPYTDRYSNDYQAASGTSMACPHVSGLAALIADAMGTWSYTEEQALDVKKIILMTSYEVRSAENSEYTPPFGSGGKDRYEGYGRVSADAAIEAVTMELDFGVSYPVSFGGDVWNKKAWARKMSLNDTVNYNFTMDVPVTGNYDLYLYAGDPDENGEPVLLDTSCSTGSTDEYIQYSPDDNGTYYLVAKWYSGSGQAEIIGNIQEPILSNPFPANGSTTVNINPTLNISIFDAQGDTMNITWYWNDTGGCYVFGTNNSVSSGTYHQSNTNFSSYETTYWWSVNCTDGTYFTNETYHFTTRSIYDVLPPSSFEAATYNKTQINSRRI